MLNFHSFAIQKCWEDRIKDEPMVFQADWEFAKKHGGILTDLVLADMDHMRDPEKTYIVDTRVHMLKPGWYPSIPGWHCDFVSRDENKKVILSPNNPDPEMWLCVFDMGTGSLTEFIDEEVDLSHLEVPEEKNLWGVHSEYLNENLNRYKTTALSSGEVYQFDSTDYHRTVPATGHGWRFFIRVAGFTEERQPRNEIRRQVQTYIPNEDWGR